MKAPICLGNSSQEQTPNAVDKVNKDGLVTMIGTPNITTMDTPLHNRPGQRLPTTAMTQQEVSFQCSVFSESPSYSTTRTTVSFVSDDPETSPYAAVVASSGPMAKSNPFRFSTKWWDDETGLGWWGYRWYSPEVGKWLSRDSIGERGGHNLYGFVGNDPVRVIDSLGLSPFCRVDTSIGDPYYQHGYHTGSNIPRGFITCVLMLCRRTTVTTTCRSICLNDQGTRVTSTTRCKIVAESQHEGYDEKGVSYNQLKALCGNWWKDNPLPDADKPVPAWADQPGKDIEPHPIEGAPDGPW